MSVNFSDISARVAAGETDETIAAALAADWRTATDISTADLIGLVLIPYGLLTEKSNGALDGPIAVAADAGDASAGKLLATIRRVQTIRTASLPGVAVAMRDGFQGLAAAGLLDAVPGGAATVSAAMYALGGGLRFRNADGSELSAADVASVRAVETERVRRSEQRSAMEIAWQAALELYSAGSSDDDVWAAFAAAKPVAE